MKFVTEVDKSYDHVVIFGQRIDRPSHMSPSQWLAFWDGGWTCERCRILMRPEGGHRCGSCGRSI